MLLAPTPGPPRAARTAASPPSPTALTRRPRAAVSRQERATTRYSPEDLRNALGVGLVSFPVTHATANLELDEPGYREHLQYLAGYDVAGLFAPGGTGEFFSLTADEVSRVLRATVEGDRRPDPGDGLGRLRHSHRGRDGAARRGRRRRRRAAAAAVPDRIHRAGALRPRRPGLRGDHRRRDHLPPGQRAIQRRVRGPASRGVPELIGFKDGVCDIDLLATLYAQHGERLVYIGGLPTAETYAPPYLELGATTYSSAIFNFAPQWAVDFYRAVRAGDREAVRQDPRVPRALHRHPRPAARVRRLHR